MGKLSTHVLDISTGMPAAGVVVRLYRTSAEGRTLLKQVATNADGRCDAALLEGEALQCGTYALAFAAGDYFRAQGVTLPAPPFVDIVTLDFGVASSAENYHVPLLVSPWAYSTYRGS